MLKVDQDLLELADDHSLRMAVETRCLVLLVLLAAVGTAVAGPRRHEPYEPEGAGPADGAVDQETIDAQQRWSEVPPGLHGSVASIDQRYEREKVSDVSSSMQWSGIAWRGERVSAQLLLWAGDEVQQVRLVPAPLRDKQGHELSAACVHAQFVRYVLADGRLLADVLDTVQRLERMEARTVRPVWVSVDVPADAHPGIYSGHLNVQADGGVLLSFELNVEVLPLVLAAPSEWSFHLDLWQNPWSVARYHHVEPWSAEHWLLLEPVLTMLAEAGQKCVSTTIVHQPWGGQTYDAFGSMIGWIKQKDGSWRFDYSIFDRYVEFCADCGITRQINCYSMVPWGNHFRYFDEGTGDYEVVTAMPGTSAYEDHWRPFLVDFVKHLRARGWLERTVVAMDERPLEPMQKMIAFLRATAPQLKIAFAGKYHPEIKFDVHDYCVFIDPPLEPGLIAERTGRGLPTTFYVCCNPSKPNTFPCSPPAESTWLGWHAAAQGYTGFLRWAYNSWVADPLYNTSHVKWTAGDCFLVYPGPRSSIRFERLREGIQDYEKIRLLREALQRSKDAKAKECLQTLETMLVPFAYKKQAQTAHTDIVRSGKEALAKVSRDAVEFLPH